MCAGTLSRLQILAGGPRSIAKQVSSAPTAENPPEPRWASDSCILGAPYAQPESILLCSRMVTGRTTRVHRRDVLGQLAGHSSRAQLLRAGARTPERLPPARRHRGTASRPGCGAGWGHLVERDRPAAEGGHVPLPGTNPYLISTLVT